VSKRPPMPRAFWLLILAIVIARTAFFVESFLTIFMKTEAGFSSALAAFIMGLYGFGGAVAAFLSGPAIDRLGPRIPLLASLVATAAAAVVLALDPPNWSLAMLVLAFGLVGQVIQPTSNAYIAQLVPESRRREAYSWSFIALNSGLAIGPLLGGYLAGIDFTLMFGVGATLIVVGALFAAVARPPGAGSQAPRAGLEPVRPMAGIRELLSDRVFVEYIGLNWLFMVLYLQVFVILPLLMLGDGLTAQDYGILMGVNGTALVLLQLPFDRAIRRFQPGRLLTAAVLLLVCGLLFNSAADRLWLYLLAAVFWTSAELINMPLATTVTSVLAPPHLRGSYLAVHGMAFPLGMGVASVIGGSAFALLGEPKLVWLILAGVGAVLAVLRFRMEGRLRERLAAASAPPPRPPA